MSAVVVPFDRRARVHADLTPDQVLRRCRIAAITSGCNSAQKRTVEAAGQHWLDLGIRAHDVIQRAKAMADLLARSHPDPEAA